MDLEVTAVDAAQLDPTLHQAYSNTGAVFAEKGWLAASLTLHEKGISLKKADAAALFNRAVVALGRSYQQLKDSLWFPPSTVTGTATEITPYDADFLNVPRANGGTAPGMGFMIAYNQLSNSVNSLRTYSTPTDTYRGNAGGLGRKGASRLIIFETDGVPNTQANTAIANCRATLLPNFGRI